MVLALSVDVLPISVTPLAELAAVLAVAGVVGVVLVAATQAGGRLVDKRWPADEPLDPTELLWGESGGHVQKAFRGLDLGEAKDIATQMVEVEVKAGQPIIEQGDPATHYFVLKEGQAEVTQRILTGPGTAAEQRIRTYAPGDSFGELGILRRTARTATVRAVTDCTVLQLAAEDFVAGAARSAADDNELLETVERYLNEDRQRATWVRGSPRNEPTSPARPDAGTASGAASSSAPAPAPARQTGPARSTAPPAPARPTAPAPPAPPPPPRAPAARTWSVPPAPPSPSAPARFSPTHRVPAGSMPAWSAPDAGARPVATLPPGTALQVLEERGAWARVAADNGWQGWVDARRLATG